MWRASCGPASWATSKLRTGPRPPRRADRRGRAAAPSGGEGRGRRHEDDGHVPRVRRADAESAARVARDPARGPHAVGEIGKAFNAHRGLPKPRGIKWLDQYLKQYGMRKRDSGNRSRFFIEVADGKRSEDNSAPPLSDDERLANTNTSPGTVVVSFRPRGAAQWTARSPSRPRS